MNTVNISFSSLDEGGDVIESKSSELPGDKKTSSFSVEDNEEASTTQLLSPDNEEENINKKVSSIYHFYFLHCFVFRNFFLCA